MAIGYCASCMAMEGTRTSRHELRMLNGGTLVSDLMSKGHRCPTSSGAWDLQGYSPQAPPSFSMHSIVKLGGARDLNRYSPQAPPSFSLYNIVKLGGAWDLHR